MRKSLEEKFSNQFFHSIVHECFLHALPFDRSGMTKNEDRKLRYYTKNVVDSIGGIHALEQAIDLNNKTLEQNLFLGELWNICTESAKKCASEECKKTEACDKNDSLKDILQKATLSDAECKEFAKKANDANLDKVAEIINKKTKKVIEDEKAQYEKEKKVNQDLQDALKDSSDSLDEFDEDEELLSEVEESTSGDKKGGQEPGEVFRENGQKVKGFESYLDIWLDKSDPRHPISMFSRLQESAMESLTLLRENEDYFTSVYATTFDSFFEAPQKGFIKPATESSVASEEVCDIKSEDKPKYATMVSIIVYTIMETLHTLGIFTPSRDAIRGFVDRGLDPRKIATKSMNSTCESIITAITEACNHDYSKMKSDKLGVILESLRTSLEDTETFMQGNGITTDMITAASEATKHIHEIEAIMHQRNIDHKAFSEATESYTTQRQKSNDLAQFNKIASLYKANPEITEIKLYVDPNCASSVIDVRCANESGQIIRKNYMYMEYACESDHYIQYLTDTFDRSKLSEAMKNVTIVVNDGTDTCYNIQ